MPWDRSHPCCDDRSRLGRRRSGGTSCDIAQHLRLPCRGRSNSEQPQTSDLDTGNITYFSDGCKSNRPRGISKCTQPDMRLETVGGVTEWARIAMLTSAGRVQRCRAPVMDPVLLPRSSGTYASSTVRRPSAKTHVAGTSVIGAVAIRPTTPACWRPAASCVADGKRWAVAWFRLQPAIRAGAISRSMGRTNGMRGMASARRSVATFNSLGVTGRDARQPRLRWARMAEMVAVVASALPPPKWAKPAKLCVSALNCR